MTTVGVFRYHTNTIRLSCVEHPIDYFILIYDIKAIASLFKEASAA
jgi:hypothetical protein